MKLRTALIDGYISILHGMNPDKDNKAHQVISQADIDTHAMQMYYYLEALVSNTELAFPPSLLKEMFELFFDLIVIFVGVRETTSGPANGLNYRPTLSPQVSATCMHMLQSDLIVKIEPGLNALDQSDQPEIRERYQQTVYHFESVKNQVSSLQGGSHNQGMAMVH